MRPETWRPSAARRDYRTASAAIQLRLWTLGYLDRSDVSGSLDYVTSQALLAFQGWEDLDRTGTVTGQTQVELFRARRPKPAAQRRGSRVEIHRDRGVLLMLGATRSCAPCTRRRAWAA